MTDVLKTWKTSHKNPNRFPPIGSRILAVWGQSLSHVSHGIYTDYCSYHHVTGKTKICEFQPDETSEGIISHAYPRDMHKPLNQVEISQPEDVGLTVAEIYERIKSDPKWYVAVHYKTGEAYKVVNVEKGHTLTLFNFKKRTITWGNLADYDIYESFARKP